MKKKMLSDICALAVASALPLSVSAADGSGETVFNAHVYSSYEITIPETVDVDSTTQVPVSLTSAYIENGYSVKVSADNLSMEGLKLLNPNYQYSEYYVSFTNLDTNEIANSENGLLVTFNASEIVNFSATKYFGIAPGQSLMPGDYTGTLQFSFECTAD